MISGVSAEPFRESASQDEYISITRVVSVRIAVTQVTGVSAEPFRESTSQDEYTSITRVVSVRIAVTQVTGVSAEPIRVPTVIQTSCTRSISTIDFAKQNHRKLTCEIS